MTFEGTRQGERWLSLSVPSQGSLDGTAVRTLIKPDLLGGAVDVDHKVLLAGHGSRWHDGGDETRLAQIIRQGAAFLEVLRGVACQESGCRVDDAIVGLGEINDGVHINLDRYEVMSSLGAVGHPPLREVLAVFGDGPFRAESGVESTIPAASVPPATRSEDEPDM